MLLTEVLSFNSLDEAQKEIEKINANPVGAKIMALKAVFKVVRIRDVDPKTANIVKQEMLSRGGDVALSRSVGRFETRLTDILVMGTLAQHLRLIRKLQHQTFGDCCKISDAIKEALFSRFDINSAAVW
jgi:dihydropteroate synthase